MSLPGLTFLETVRAMPLLVLPVRSTVVRLEGGVTLFVSPGSTLTEAELRSAGEVTDIVAPNLLHTEGVVSAAAAHPSARLWGPEGAQEKQPSLRWHGVLSRDPWPHEAELRHVAIGGMPGIRESVFLHVRSRTLLVTDLVFHLEDARGVGAWLFLHAFGTYRRFAVSRFYTRQVKDRDAFARSLGAIAALDFDAVVPAHGSIVTDGGKARLLAAFAERGYAVGSA